MLFPFLCLPPVHFSVRNYSLENVLKRFVSKHQFILELSSMAFPLSQFNVSYSRWFHCHVGFFPFLLCSHRCLFYLLYITIWWSAQQNPLRLHFRLTDEWSWSGLPPPIPPLLFFLACLFLLVLSSSEVLKRFFPFVNLYTAYRDKPVATVNSVIHGLLKSCYLGEHCKAAL